jgi:hypothetical protein
MREWFHWTQALHGVWPLERIRFAALTYLGGGGVGLAVLLVALFFTPPGEGLRGLVAEPLAELARRGSGDPGRLPPAETPPEPEIALEPFAPLPQLSEAPTADSASTSGVGGADDSDAGPADATLLDLSPKAPAEAAPSELTLPGAAASIPRPARAPDFMPNRPSTVRPAAHPVSVPGVPGPPAPVAPEAEGVNSPPPSISAARGAGVSGLFALVGAFMPEFTRGTPTSVETERSSAPAGPAAATGVRLTPAPPSRSAGIHRAMAVGAIRVAAAHAAAAATPVVKEARGQVADTASGQRGAPGKIASGTQASVSAPGRPVIRGSGAAVTSLPAGPARALAQGEGVKATGGEQGPAVTSAAAASKPAQPGPLPGVSSVTGPQSPVHSNAASVHSQASAAAHEAAISPARTLDTNR